MYYILQVWALFEENKNQESLNEGILESVRRHSSLSPPHPSSSLASSSSSSLLNNNINNATRAPCFSFQETGFCRNEKCKFSHDVGLQSLSSTTAKASTAAAAASFEGGLVTTSNTTESRKLGAFVFDFDCLLPINFHNYLKW